MAGIGVPIRAVRPNRSNLGAAIRVEVLQVDQFTPGALWPRRSDIVGGQVSTVPPLIATEKSSIIAFDIETGVEVNSRKSGKIVNQSYQHFVRNMQISGHIAEQNVGLDKLYNMGNVLVMTYPDGRREVCGTTWAPLYAKDERTSGPDNASFAGLKLDFEMVQSVDFNIPLLASSVVIATETIPAQV